MGYILISNINLLSQCNCTKVTMVNLCSWLQTPSWKLENILPKIQIYLFILILNFLGNEGLNPNNTGDNMDDIEDKQQGRYVL